MSKLVDFKKLLGKKRIILPTDPISIFKDLDKKSGKEYLRPPQESVLKDWYDNHRSRKDVIVKLHTGQGKTLIGLLILQSCINDGKGPAMYVCPNNYLVDQIVEQADSFGIRTTQFVDRKPPVEFLNSEAILVTNCNKLFNGKSVFGVRGSRIEPIHLGAIVVDDAHKCVDIMRGSFSIIVERQDANGDANPLYEQLWALFEDSLRRQAPGTCTDVLNGEDCLMAVPFWTWHDKHDDVLRILSENKDSAELLFVWDLLKDHISECTCVFSGERLEITPRLLPVDSIPSFSEAKRRIFLSATLTEDAFLVRDLGISPESVTNPLCSGDVQYCGERLVLLPSLVDTNLHRKKLIPWVQTLAARSGSFGVVAIVPSFGRADEWKTLGAEVVNVRELYESIDDLRTKVRNKAATNVLVLVNEYDGVDLPDSTCRILVLDSLPSYATLMDRYVQAMRPTSGIIRRQLAQRVEQGMGRAIRGFSDWCIVIILGNNITDFLSEKSKRAFLSEEAQLQIRIGEELVQELKEEGGQIKAIEKLINQVLSRDANWKEYYKDQMSGLKPDEPKKVHLDRAVSERNAELLYRQGQYRNAVDALQGAIDSTDPNDRGWFHQLMATFLYPIDRKESMNKQLKAHMENINLFRPETGITYSKMTSSGTRASRINDWIKEHESYNALILDVQRIMDCLLWNLPSDLFEQGIFELGQALGFISERPEKKTGKGPDNLWNIQGKMYWLIECKNQIRSNRTQISKTEAGQLANSIGWFKEHYGKEEQYPILIHPATGLASDAYVADPFWVMHPDDLKNLQENTRKFYNSITGIPFDSLRPETITKKLKDHSIDSDDLVKTYLHRGERASKS